MINKNLVKNSFRKNLKTYDANATVQKEMAEQLIELLPERSFDFVLEIGMGTGLLTNQLLDEINCTKYCANDIVIDCKKYLKQHEVETTFLEGDIEEIELEGKFDLVISNATLQWADNFVSLSQKIKDILNDKGLFVFSTFAQDNFIELKDITGIGLEYYSVEELKNIVEEDFEIVELKEEKSTICFKNFREILRHIKATGVNGVCMKKMSFLELRAAEKKYKETYKTDEGLKLTYNPVFVVLKKK